MSQGKNLKVLLDIYNECVNCKKCSNVLNDRENGDIPRGFYFEKLDVPVLAIAKNPGHMLPEEREEYKKAIKTSIECVRNKAIEEAGIFFNHGGDLLKREEKISLDHRFQFNIMKYFTQFFCTGRPKDVFQHVAITNLVKCSTANERGRLENEIIKECYQKFLKFELDFFKPRVIIAFGREVEKFLKTKWKEFPYVKKIVYVRHPSYFYAKDKQTKELEKIENEIKDGLA